MNHHFKDLKPLYDGSSNYKAAREDGLFSFVKFFPSVFSTEDKKVLDERSALIHKVIEEYSADIPAVTGSGQQGSFSYLEFEWITGINLSERMKVERVSLLPMQQVLQVAEQVSRTLTLCHKAGLQHGGFELKNILWDASKGRYVVTGFFTIMENTGQTISNKFPEEELRKKDINDVASVLLKLTTGSADDKIEDEEKWNEQRRTALNKQGVIYDEAQEQVPSWFSGLLLSALKGNSFDHMGDLYFSIIKNNRHSPSEKIYRSKPQVHAVPIIKPARINTISDLRTLPVVPVERKKKFVFDGKMAAGFLVAALLFGFSIFSQKNNKKEKQVAGISQLPSEPVVVEKDTVVTDLPARKVTPPVKKEKKKLVDSLPVQQEAPVMNVALTDTVTAGQQTAPLQPQETETVEATGSGLGFYMVKSKAFFHNLPDASTKRKGFIIHWNNAILIPIKEENNFVYVVYTNHKGQTSRGWLNKDDLVEVDEK